VNATSIPASFIQYAFAERIGGHTFGIKKNIYKFEQIKLAKAQAIQKRPEQPILDMGVGQPQDMVHPAIVQSLQHAAEKEEYQGYADNGGYRFKAAVQAYMKGCYGVDLDAQTQIIHCIGAKSALSLLPAAFINPGDIVLTTTPGYNVFGTHAQYYGGQVIELPLLASNQFLPELDLLPLNIAQKAKVLILNYPNNPTGACAHLDFFRSVVDWAYKNQVIIIHDAAYAALTYGQKPLSILQVPQAEDIAIEIHSLSKAFNMTGWRLGWVCGAQKLVEAFAHVKDHSDSGQFLAIQEAGITALQQPEITTQAAQMYQRRSQQVASILEQVGFKITIPQAGFFLYTPSPKAVLWKNQRINFPTAQDASHWLITQLSISTVPWDDAGAFLRFSMTFNAHTAAAEHLFFEELQLRLRTNVQFLFND